MSEVERYVRAGVPVKIMWDEDGGSYADPRENTNVGTFVHWHRNYELGDRKLDSQEDEAMRRGGLNLLVRYLKLCRGATCVIPVGMIDHSGISVYAGGGTHWSDSAGWDSGTVGVIYDTPESREETGVSNEEIERILRTEIEEYDKFVRGEIYGYEVGDDRLRESCWGFLGLDVVREEAKQAADAIAEDYSRKLRIEAACKFKPESFSYAA